MSLANLDLSNVEVGGGGTMLKVGKYVCEVTEAEYSKTKAGDGTTLRVKFTDKGGQGSIQTWINVFNRNPKSQESGRKTLKRLTVYGGHPTPNKPTDVKLFKGLVVGIEVGEGQMETYNGVTRPKIIVKSIFCPSHLDPSIPPRTMPDEAATPQSSINDDIPF